MTRITSIAGASQFHTALSAGRRPAFIIVFFNDGDSQTKLTKSIHHYPHLKINKLQATFEGKSAPSSLQRYTYTHTYNLGQSFPSDELAQADFSVLQPTKDSGQARKWFGKLLGLAGTDHGYSSGITYEMFVNNKVWLVIPFTGEKLTNQFVSPPQYGSLTLRMNFDEPLPENKYLYVYGVFFDSVIIDKSKVIQLSYSPQTFG